jgi:GT2 family glycosyltransferase
MTRIAVLVPSYNPGPELAGTLDSLRQQSVPFRLYLVDDGSKIHTDYETLTQGIDVRILRLPKNLGITGAMNAGLAEILRGTYDYVARLDVGDFCAPQRFATQLSFMDAHPDVGIVGSAVEFRILDSQGRMTHSSVVPFPLTPEAAAQRLFKNSSVIHPAMLIRRKVFEVLKGYSEDYPAAEDYDLLWRAHNAGFGLVNLPDTLLIKEETPGSISQKRRRRQIISRLRLQWAHRNLLKPASWIGMLKSIIIWALPGDLVHALKFKARS